MSLGKHFFHLAIVFCFFAAVPLHAAAGGSISGAVIDLSGAVIPGAALKLVNTGQHTVYQAVSDRQGFYSFPNLPVGHYELTISASGFTTQRKTNLTVDTDAALRVDATLAIGGQSYSVTVTSDAGVQVETAATHLGEVVSSAQISASRLWKELHGSPGNSARSGSYFDLVA